MSGMRILVFWASQVLGILVSVLTLVWIFKHRGGFTWRSDPKKQFSWHPTFMVIGMIYFFSHGLVIFRIFPHLKKWPLKMIHMAINLMAGCLAAFALIAVIDERNVAGKDHFQSLHSWIGIGALGLFAIQWAAGFLFYLVPCTPNSIRARTISWHVNLGKAIFILSTIATITGIKNVSGKADHEERTLLNVLGIFVILVLLFHLGVLAKFSLLHPDSSSRPPSARTSLTPVSPTSKQ